MGSLNGSVNSFQEDSLILSFSSELSAELAVRLGKMAVVRLHDPIATYNHICDQLSKKGKIEFVEYTKGPERNAFLKGQEDACQHEVRMNWPVKKPQEVWVELHRGTAEAIDLALVGNPRRLDASPFPDFDKRVREENSLFERLTTHYKQRQAS